MRSSSAQGAHVANAVRVRGRTPMPAAPRDRAFAPRTAGRGYVPPGSACTKLGEHVLAHAHQRRVAPEPAAAAGALDRGGEHGALDAIEVAGHQARELQSVE